MALQWRSRSRLENTASPRPYPRFELSQIIVQQAQPQHLAMSLLGLPLEVREVIWQYIHEQIESNSSKIWFEKPVTEYNGLALTCRQIYHELSRFWHRWIVPCHRLQHFMNQSYSKEKLKNFKSLSIEIPFNMSPEFFRCGAVVLTCLSPQLRKLQIFFTGRDNYGVKTYLHGCGNKLPSAASTTHKLLIDGQGAQERKPFIHALTQLTKLELLVLSNVNLPLLQSHIIKDKPKLRKLCIVSDPRSSLYIPYRYATEAQYMAQVEGGFPAVKELQISANSTLVSIQVASKLIKHMEHLTWIVPDASRQAGSLPVNWYRDTGILFCNIRSNAKLLHTLRVCMEGSIYEGHVSYGDLIGQFRAHAPLMSTLRQLELHIWSKSPWMAEEFIEALPPSVERLYLSDRFATTHTIVSAIWSKYLGLQRTGKSLVIGENLDRQDFIPMNTGNLGFLAFEYDRFTGNGETELHDATLCDEAEMNEIDHETDNSAFNMPELGWVLGQEKDSASSITKTANLEEDVKEPDLQRFALMKLNGRLLDREWNKHLAPIQGEHIEPHQIHTTAETNDGMFQSHLTKQKGNASRASMCKKQNKKWSRPRARGFDFYRYYFGNESAAEEVFKNEKVADTIEVLARSRTYPVETEVGKHDHWMCP